MNRQMRIADSKIKLRSLQRRGVSVSLTGWFLLLFFLGAWVLNVPAQDIIPAPGAVKSVSIPAVKEAKLKNGLTVAVVEKRSVPIVTVQLLVRYGA